ncbi:MAG: ribbon-helix-helix domain-containing protein [Patescibacteria group bacterium]
MTTVNISLTTDQAQLVERLTTSLGFANRSEFFRALLRRLSLSETVQKEIAYWPFTSPVENNRTKILADFKNTKKYSTGFLKDLKEGLASSNYFKD